MCKHGYKGGPSGFTVPLAGPNTGNYVCTLCDTVMTPAEFGRWALIKNQETPAGPHNFENNYRKRRRNAA